MTREQKLEAALRDMVHAVCGPTGLHEAVKIDTGMSYPWPALDLAEDAAYQLSAHSNRKERRAFEAAQRKRK